MKLNQIIRYINRIGEIIWIIDGSYGIQIRHWRWPFQFLRRIHSLHSLSTNPLMDEISEQFFREMS